MIAYSNGTNKIMFAFKGYKLNKEDATAVYNYELEHKGEVFSFAEKISFDKARADFSRAPEQTLSSALQTLSLILGISYYKLFCPKEIRLDGFSLSPEQAKFWNAVYTKGLGEFFYRNKIDFRGLINFPSSEGKNITPQKMAKTGKSLVLWGGGKDSIVTAELFKKAGKNFALFSLNDYVVQRETAKIAGIMAAKSTPSIIPMCHLLELSQVKIAFEPREKDTSIVVTSEVVCRGRTGVEMEALTAVCAAALTIYDMMKWADHAMVITEIQLLHKSGGKSGTFNRSE